MAASMAISNRSRIWLRRLRSQLWQDRRRSAKTPRVRAATACRLVAMYLSEAHRDDPGKGCPLTARRRIRRQDGPIRAAFTAGIQSYLGILAKMTPGRSAAAKRARALSALSELVGAVVLARATDDPLLSNEILAATAQNLAPSHSDRRRLFNSADHADAANDFLVTCIIKVTAYIRQMDGPRSKLRLATPEKLGWRNKIVNAISQLKTSPQQGFGGRSQVEAAPDREKYDIRPGVSALAGAAHMALLVDGGPIHAIDRRRLCRRRCYGHSSQGCGFHRRSRHRGQSERARRRSSGSP